MNDLDPCLEVVSRSCQPLRHIRTWISWKPLEIEAWFQMTTNRKWPLVNSMVTTSRDTENSSRDPNTLRVQYRKTPGEWRCYLATSVIASKYDVRHYGWLS